MRTAAITHPTLLHAPKLRLLPKEGSVAKRDDDVKSLQLRLVGGPAPAEKPVLLAGGDASARSSVRRDLAETMPRSATFEQAGAIWELLIRAPEASMVVLSGELEEIPAQSLMQMLVHRSPEVPVVCLDAPMQRAV
jgi:hypothetical protein